jgi:hypothetical protein
VTLLLEKKATWLEVVKNHEEVFCLDNFKQFINDDLKNQEKAARRRAALGLESPTDQNASPR